MQHVSFRYIAIRAAVGGEAVAEISVSDRSIDLHRRRRQESELGNDAALRAYLGDGIHKLYASPPATVDVGALRKYIASLKQHADVGIAGAMAHKIADELAALIGEKA